MRLTVALLILETGLALLRRDMWRNKSILPVRNGLWRQRLFSSSVPVNGSTAESKKRIVFLGTPSVAAESLQLLYEASMKSTDFPFEVVSVVSQPISGVKKKPSPVQVTAHKLGLPMQCPETAKDPDFLSHLESLNVDLCITAAYGNFLPKRFLAIPKFGTVNIHPSLLPKYRGAAPVQRCLENGDARTGVSVAFTVLKMDAGPIIRQIPYELNGAEKAPTVLSDCFRLGTSALIDALPGIFTRTVTTTLQEESAKSEAPKLTVEEGVVDFATLSAGQIHNKCRGFAEWPGVVGSFQIGAEDKNASQALKLVTTVVLEASAGAAACTNDVGVVKHHYNGKDAHMLRVVCGDGSVLGIVEVLPPNRRVMPVQDFMNGLRGDKRIRWVAPSPSANLIPV